MALPLLASLRQRPLTAARTAFDWVFEQFASRTRVLFVLTDAYGFDGQSPVLRALLQYPDILVRVTTDKQRNPREFEFTSTEDRTLFDNVYTSPSRARFTKWHMVIDTHMNSFYPAFNALRVFMHHGPGFGNTGNKYAIVRRYDIYCGLSGIEREWLGRVHPGIFGERHAFFPVGFPKSDALYQGRFNRDETLSSLNLPDRPTILITSHWEKQAILRCLNAAVLRELATAFPDYNIIQTGHPWLWQSNHAIPEEWRNALLNEIYKLQEQNPHVRFVQTSHVESLLAATDLLIGDSSSVMTTFSLLDRPIIFFDNPDFQFAIPELKQVFINASHSFTRIEELVATCREALSNPGIKAEGRARMRETFYANEGRSATFMADLIRRIGHVSSIHSPEWKRVLELANNHTQASQAMDVTTS
jgi:hypothetical protein